MTSAELTELYLSRLKKHDPALECVISLTEERALEQAEEADRHFHVLKKSHRSDEEVREELVETMDDWIQKVLGGAM